MYIGKYNMHGWYGFYIGLLILTTPMSNSKRRWHIFALKEKMAANFFWWLPKFKQTTYIHIATLHHKNVQLHFQRSVFHKFLTYSFSHLNWVCCFRDGPCNHPGSSQKVKHFVAEMRHFSGTESQIHSCHHRGSPKHIQSDSFSRRPWVGTRKKHTLRDIPRKPTKNPRKKLRFRLWIPLKIEGNAGSHGICKGERTPRNFGVKYFQWNPFTMRPFIR